MSLESDSIPSQRKDNTGEHKDSNSTWYQELYAGIQHGASTPVRGFAQLQSKADSGTVAAAGTVAGDGANTSVMRSIGEAAGTAALFYGATTLLRGIPKIGKVAPMLAGGALGFLEPTKDPGSISERIANTASGALSIGIMEKFPEILGKQGFRSDFVGNTAKVVFAGALAGAADVQIHSVAQDGRLAGLGQTAESALGWGAVGGVFHIGSLGLAKGFQSGVGEKKELLLFAPNHRESTYRTREFLSSLSPYGINFRQVGAVPGSGARTESSTVLFPNGHRVLDATPEKLAQELKLHTVPDYEHYRVAVIGSGPAGTQTAINAATELSGDKEKVALIADVLGGQARYTSSVKNYMGFPDIKGADLMKQGIQGARKHGAELIVNRVTDVEQANGRHELTLANGKKITADAVVLATGMKYNCLEAPGADRLNMRGVYTLADASEAPRAKGQSVFIVGAGNSAGQAAINFSRYAKEVNVLVRGDDLGKSMSEYLVQEIKRAPNIKVHLNSEVKELVGDKQLEKVTFSTTGAEGTKLTSSNANALYAYIGGKPNTEFLRQSGIAQDKKGFILTGRQVEDGGLWQTQSERPVPLPFETNIPGVFAAGDVNSANPQKRIVSAVGDAGKLIGSLHTHLSSIPITEPIFRSPVPSHDRNIPSNILQIKLPTLAVGALGSSWLGQGA